MDAGRDVGRDRQRRFAVAKTAQKMTGISAGVYLGITGMELFVAQVAHSDALIADGLNNLTGVASSLVLWWGLHLTRRAPDNDHRLGHWRFQTVSTLLAAIIMYAVALDAIVTGANGLWALYQGAATTPEPLAFMVTAIAGTAMTVVMLATRWQARKLGSSVLHAVSKDSLNDALTSYGAMIAIGGAYFGWFWLDGLAAMVVGILIAKGATDIFRGAVFELTDGFDEERLHAFTLVIAQVPGVQGVRMVEARSLGDWVQITVGIEVAPNMHVDAAYALGERVEAALMARFDILDADVKVYPLQVRK